MRCLMVYLFDLPRINGHVRNRLIGVLTIYRILKFPLIEVSMTRLRGTICRWEAGTFALHRHSATSDLALWQDRFRSGFLRSNRWTELGSFLHGEG